MKRGELWWASVAAPIGRRPVLVIQSNLFNASRIQTVVVALVTSNLALEKAPGNVRLAQGQGGIPKSSVVNVSQIYTIDRQQLTERIGTLDHAMQQRVSIGLRLVLDLEGGVSGQGVMDPAAEYLVRKPGRPRHRAFARFA